MRKFNKGKLMSFLLSIMMVFTFIPTSLVFADDIVNEIEEHEHSDECEHEDVEVNDISELSTSTIKPQINMQYGGIIPENPMVGQEFEVTYTINPEPFQHNISQPKEIVLVLDGSGSMDTTVKCEHGYTSSHWVNGTRCFPKTRLEELKEAAIAFINKMKSVENLKIGIVVYSSSATINPISRSGTTTVRRYYNGSWSDRSVPKYQSYTEEYFLPVDDSRLITMINNIYALGGTNTGEGLRKAKFLLNQGDSKANKTIILMSDGLPTYYSITGTTLGLYKEINNITPSISGAGNENSQDNINKSSAYAEQIGSEKIRGNGYNIFSIGYGLGASTSTGNIKMRAIHTAMGGVANILNPDDPNNTFFATSEGAIDSVFNKIADTLINSYSINDVKLNLNLSDSISGFNGGTVNINGHQIEIDPIVYERKENNWYRAESQTVKFKVKANKSGTIDLFKDGSSITYTDIEGKSHSISIPNQQINIREYSATDADKLGVTFAPTRNGYLIGDTVNIGVTFSHSGMNNIRYTEAKFNLNLNTKPSNFQPESSFNKLLNFGTITENKSMSYDFTINNEESINSEIPTQYTLSGSYEYKINGTIESNNNVTTNVNVKRGQIKVKVNDSINNDITASSVVILKDKYNNEITGIYSNEYIVFDEVPTGSHEIILKEVPEGCSINEENKNKIISVNYENPVGIATFNSEGFISTIDLEINTELKGFTPSEPKINDRITITYDIIPQEFAKNSTQDIILNETLLNFDFGNNFEGVASDNLIKNSYGKWQYNIGPITYTYDAVTKKYKANPITISFDVIAKEVGENLTFASAEMIYRNILGNTETDIKTKQLEKPKINVTKSTELEIEANLISATPSYPYVDEDITVTYAIDPKEFTKESNEDISITNAKLIFDLGADFTAVEGQGLVQGENGKYILDFADKIKYTYDTINNKYTGNRFTVSFKVKANRSGNNITFSGGNIEYTNILIENSQVITKPIDVPIMTIRDVISPPLGSGPDIRVLEIEPADAFKLTTNPSGETTTGIEPGKDESGNSQYIKKTINDVIYNVEIVHMTMSEFIGKVDDLNGKYDVIVIGNYVKQGINSIYNFNNTAQYIKSDGYKNIDNDITKRKADEITDFINSGQLVFIDSTINSIEKSKLNTYANGEWNSSKSNLINSMSVNNTDENSLDLTYIVESYHNIISTNSSMKRPKLMISNPEQDNNDDTLGSIYKRNMRFNINAIDLTNENVTINLYLDINGDGLFKEEEIVKSIENVIIPNEGYRIDYDFYKDYPHFVGYLDWRIEVVKESVSLYEEPIKSYYNNNVLFRRVTEQKRQINVLQVSPYNKADIENSNSNRKTNLKQNNKFMQLLGDLQDYDVNIDVISYEQFYTNDNYIELKDTDLKKSKYDIVILGFSDEYKNRNLNQTAINQIKEFIKSGQGLMLTHDTIYKTDFRAFKEFRDIAGQSRYVDSNNPNELDIDGISKIPHDIDDTNSDPRGESLWQTYDYGGRNGNSTLVYKVNQSLLTTYPYELEDNITIRRTHGQYYELNLEDENVVTSFTLTNYNIGQNGSTSRNAKADKYDVRNNYYTYSKGNITFSGTGEDGREDEYPEQELKLFVNTIVKAERGANHKPEISGLENVSEIPYNSDLSFNAIVKDVDGDKVKVNKISLNGKDISLQVYNESINKIPSDFKNQGSQFPITIPSKLFTVNSEMVISVEAEDSRGAVSTKEYKITPVQNPLLTSKGETINSLVGENVTFLIKLDKENDTTPSSILIDNIELPNKDGIVSLGNIATKIESGELYLVGSLTSLVESSGEEIPIKINYSNGTSSMKTVEVKIILNSRFANVNVILKGNDGTNQNLGIAPKIILLNKTNNKSYENNISAIDGQTNFSLIEAGKYEMSISELVGYDISSASINGTNSSLSSDGNIQFNISFTESSKIIEVRVNPQVSDITHGLYEGLGNSGEINISENANGFEMVSNMNVNFGSTFILGGNSASINLSIDSNLVATNLKDEVNKNNIKVYKVSNDNEQTILTEFTGTDLDIKKVDSGYTINIKQSIDKDTKILIMYSAKIPNNSKNKIFNNNITISNKSKSVKVYTRDTEENKPAYLPDLF